MWTTGVFVLITCCYVNAQFMPTFSGCGCSGPCNSNFNYQPSNCPFPIANSNIGCNCGCSNSFPLKSRFTFPTFCSSSFNNAKFKCSPSPPKDAPVTTVSPTTEPTNTPGPAPAVNRTCSCETPIQPNTTVTECTPRPNTEITTPPPIIEPTSTTAAPIEAVQTIAKEVVETVVKEAETQVEKKVEENVTNVTEPVASTTPISQCSVINTTATVQTLNNDTASCELPAQATCAPANQANSLICIANQSDISCPNTKSCSNQSLNMSPNSQSTKCLPIQCIGSCENICPNQCPNDFVNLCPSQCVNLYSSQYYPCCNDYQNQFENPRPDEFVDPFRCVNPYPCQMLNPCISDCPKQLPNPNIDEFWNTCPSICPKQCSNQCNEPNFNEYTKPDINQFRDPCPRRCMDPFLDECISPCPNQLNSYGNPRYAQHCIPCTRNTCPYKCLINTIPCNCLDQNRNGAPYTCHLCYPGANARVNPNIHFNPYTDCRSNDFMEYPNSPDFLNTVEKYPINLCYDRF